MFFGQQHDDLLFAQTEAKRLMYQPGTQPKVLSVKNFSTFCGQLGYSFKLIWQEKEIILFALLQWVAIVLAYMLWVQVLDWIPDSVWQEIDRSNKKDDDGAFALLNLLLLGWSFLVIMMVSYPISLFSAAMVAAHYLRHSGQVSTVGSCLRVAGRNIGKLWIFTTIDAWITTSAILDRLPKKRGRRTALEEALYYAWKIGTVGVLPALVAGKNYLDAAKDSIILLKNQPGRVIGIRMGYSLLCWLIGIGAYCGSLYYFMIFGERGDGPNALYNFYFMMMVPIMIAVGVTSVLVRPLFLIMTAKLYTEHVAIAAPDTETPREKSSDILAFAFVIILGALAGSVAFDHQLGIVEWVESLAAKDLEEYRRMLLKP